MRSSLIKLSVVAALLVCFFFSSASAVQDFQAFEYEKDLDDSEFMSDYDYDLESDDMESRFVSSQSDYEEFEFDSEDLESEYMSEDFDSDEDLETEFQARNYQPQCTGSQCGTPKETRGTSTRAQGKQYQPQCSGAQCGTPKETRGTSTRFSETRPGTNTRASRPFPTNDVDAYEPPCPNGDCSGPDSSQGTSTRASEDEIETETRVRPSAKSVRGRTSRY